MLLEGAQLLLLQMNVRLRSQLRDFSLTKGRGGRKNMYPELRVLCQWCNQRPVTKHIFLNETNGAIHGNRSNAFPPSGVALTSCS